MGNKKMNRRKAFYILVAILVSAAIWFYVDEFGNNGSARLVEQKVTDIPIEYTSEDTLTDRGLMLLKDGTLLFSKNFRSDMETDVPTP